MIQEKNENINKQTNKQQNKQTNKTTPPKKENETNNAEKIIPIDIEHQIHF